MSTTANGGMGMRTLAEITDRLRESQLHEVLGEESLELATLVVVGEQSAGKSSLLRLITGLEILPSDSKICTRNPTVLSLQHDDACGVPLYRFDDVDDEFSALSEREVQEHILQMQAFIADNEHRPVSSKEIRLTIRSDQLPTLTLIDLPGRVRSQVEYASDIDSMVRRYIRSKNAIILAVTPLAGTPDLDNSSSIEIAREVDPLGERTIGILTKVDLVDEGCSLRDILQHGHQLQHGFFAVKGPSNKQLQQGADAREAERRWFKEHPEYAEDLPERCGTAALGSYLEHVYLGEVRRVAFSVLPRIPAIKRQLERELEALAPLQPEEAKDEIGRIVRAFCDEYKGQLEGQLMTATSRAHWGDTAKKKIEDRMKERMEAIALALTVPQLPDHQRMHHLITSRGDFIFMSDDVFHMANEPVYRQVEELVRGLLDAVEGELEALADTLVVEARHKSSEHAIQRVRIAMKEMVADFSEQKVALALRLVKVEEWSRWINHNEFTERSRAAGVWYGEKKAHAGRPAWRQERWKAPEWHCADCCEHRLSNGESCGAEGFATLGCANRRHHCRACGTTVCGRHSTNVLLLGTSMAPERVCESCWLADRQWSLAQVAQGSPPAPSLESEGESEQAPSKEGVPDTEEEAMVRASAIRIQNDAEETICVQVYNGGDSLCLYAYEATYIEPGRECMCQAYAGEEGELQVYVDGASHRTVQVGRAYRWSSEGQLLPGNTTLPGQAAQLRLRHNCPELSQQEFERADQMIRMCEQYLSLVARKLRDELPKMVFSELLSPVQCMEGRLKTILRQQGDELLEVMTSQAPEAVRIRTTLDGRLRTLERISTLLKSTEFSGLSHSVSLSHSAAVSADSQSAA